MKFDVGQPVLVRNNDEHHWEYGLFSHIDYELDSFHPYHANGSRWSQCIPYKGYEDYVGTTKKCSFPYDLKEGDPVFCKDHLESDWSVGIFAGYASSEKYPFRVYKTKDNGNSKPNWLYYQYCEPFIIKK